jgi:DNA topoisomerase-1
MFNSEKTGRGKIGREKAGVVPPPPPAVPAGLRYVTDTKPGFTRKRRGKAFVFFDAKGKAIKDPEIIDRIRHIGIPPAYERVWICPYANGHIQATGYDARGRKQYRYHTKWRAVRDGDKFSHLLQFGAALPKIRRQAAAHMKESGLTRNKVLAAVVSLLEKTLIRVGNAEYARDNASYGLTTMRLKHVAVEGADIRFKFMGKSGKQWDLAVHDRRIAHIVKNCADIPGHELFKYVGTDGKAPDVGSHDVNAYLQEITGDHFTAKDFRTWAGTTLAALALKEFVKYDSQAQAKKNVVQAIEHVSKRLGNTPAICRKCYIHPEIVDAYMDGNLAAMVEQKIDKEIRQDYAALDEDELMVMAFLRKRLAQPHGKKPTHSLHKSS